MKKILIFVFVFLLSIPAMNAQNEWSVNDGALLDGKNIVKINLTSLVTRNFAFYGERILGKHFSAIVGVSFRPLGSVPYTNYLDLDEESTVNNIRINSFSFTPELRIYTGKGYGRGFYLSPYFKYEHYRLDDLAAKFRSNDNIERQILLNGKLNTFSGGLMIGYQWLIGKNKNIVIDWSMLGLHGGKCSGNLTGQYINGSLTPEQQDEIKEDIDSSLKDIPLIDYSTTVTDKTAKIDLKGPWAFFRMGLSFGFRF